MAVYRTYFIAGRGPGWREKLQLALLALGGGAVLAAALVFSIGLALILIPVVGLAYLFRRPLMRAALRRMNIDPDLAARQRPEAQPFAASPTRDERGGVTIDADYTVVEPRDRRDP